MLKPLALSLLLSLLAVSCAPGAFGPGTRGNPVRLSFNDAATVPQNSERFFVITGPIRAISNKLRDEALGGLTSYTNPKQGEKASTDVFWFRVDKVSTVKGVEVGLVRQTATREIGEVGTTTFSILDSVDLVFAIKVPSSVAVGTYPVSIALLNSSTNVSAGTALVTLTVTAPSASASQ